MPASGRSEGIRLAEQFVCEAIGEATCDGMARGRNEGFRLAGEIVVEAIECGGEEAKSAAEVPSSHPTGPTEWHPTESPAETPSTRS